MPEVKRQIFKGKQRWHWIFYILAGLDLVTLLVSLGMTHVLSDQYSSLVKEIIVWNSVQEQISGLYDSFSELNAPGNNIFDTRNVEHERDNFWKAKLNYKENFQILQSRIEDIPDKKLSKELLENLNEVEFRKYEMSSKVENIFDLFLKNQINKAAEQMAQMDKRYSELLKKMRYFEKRIHDIQRQGILKQEKKADRVNKLEFVIGFMVLGLIFCIVVYGKKVSQYVQTTQFDDFLLKEELKEKNQELTQILKALENSAIVSLADDKGRIIRVNDKFIEISGYSGAELLGQDHRKIRSNYHDKPFFKNLWNTILSGQVWSGEIQNNKKDGTAYWVQSFISPIANSAGKITSFLSVRFDITAKKQAEEDLRNHLIWHKAVMDGAKYSMISASVDGIITTFNQAAEKMLGYRAEEVIGKVTPAIIHDLDEVVRRSAVLSKELGEKIEPGFDSFVAKARKFGPDTNEWTYIRKDGSRFPVRLCVTAVRNQQQEIIGYLGIAEDLTEEKQMRSTIEKQQAQMLSSSRLSSLGEMAGGVAHEINNPLSIILGRTGNIKTQVKSGNINPEKLIEGLEKIDSTVERIAKIVRGLRTFSRNAEKDAIVPAKLSDIISDTLELCREKLKHHGVELKLNAITDITLNCRPAQISQVLMNLISNAADAVENLPEKWIEITVREGTRIVSISVTDSGHGISENISDKMMQPFFTTKVVGKGTGLGLSISNGIIEDHNGLLSYDKKSKHTRFVIELPIRIESAGKKSA